MPLKMIKGSEKNAMPIAVHQAGALARLQHVLVRASFFNLFLLAVAGVLLRTYPFTDALPFSYKNLLHGHSHFAFGGWVMPVLLALIIRLFPMLAKKVAYVHWRNIAALLLVSAYGMLISFPVQGYAAVSIIFSTMSVLASYYLVCVLWRPLQNAPHKASFFFLKWGLVFLALSAVGPFATGPLIAVGKAGSPIYYNAVYFYLHFQYNGWFTFAILALLYRQMEQAKQGIHGKRVFKLFALSCIPTFALSLLWNQPSVIYNIVGGAGALLQLAGLYYFLKDIRHFTPSHSWLKPLLVLALAAFVLKNALQLMSALPSVAQLAYLNRNFIIAYLHLVLLGFISLYSMAMAFQHFYIRYSIYIKLGLAFFLFSFIATELLLVAAASANLAGAGVPMYVEYIWLLSLPFPLGLLLVFYSTNQQLQGLMYLE